MNQRKTGVLLAYSNVMIKNLSLFIYTPILLTHLGETEYGIYQMVNSLISNLTIMNMGLSFAYIKFFMRESSKKNSIQLVARLNGLYVMLYTVICCITLLVGFFLVSRKKIFFSTSLGTNEMDLMTKLMVVLILNIVINFFSSIFDATILAHEQFKFQQTRQLAQTILFPLVCIPAITLLKTGAFSIVLVQTSLSVIFLFLNVRFCIARLHMKFSFQRVDMSILKEITTFSFFIFLNQVFNQINDTAPTFIIGASQGAEKVAIYTIVNQIKAVFLLLSQTITNVFIPQVNRMVHETNSNNDLLQLIIKIGKVQAFILGLFVGGFVIVGKYFLTMWVGPNFEMSYYLLVSILFPLLIPLSQNIVLEIQLARHKHMFRAIVLTIFSILNIAITILMVSKVGVVGLTTGYIISLVFGYGIIMNWYYHNKLQLNMITFWKNYIPCLIPFFIATIVSHFLFQIRIDNIVSFVTVGALYTIIYIVVSAIVNPEIYIIVLRKGL